MELLNWIEFNIFRKINKKIDEIIESNNKKERLNKINYNNLHMKNIERTNKLLNIFMKDEKIIKELEDKIKKIEDKDYTIMNNIRRIKENLNKLDCS